MHTPPREIMDTTIYNNSPPGTSSAGGWTMGRVSKRTKTQPIINSKVIKHDTALPLQNSFAPLEQHDNEDDAMSSSSSTTSRHSNQAKNARVPPVVLDIPSITLKSTLQYIKTISNDIEIKYKNKQTYLHAPSMEIYNKLMDGLKNNNINVIPYHTFTLQNNKSIRYVIKGLHEFTDCNDILLDNKISSLGATKVNQIKSMKTKQLLPLYIVEFPAQTAPAKITAIKDVCNIMIKWDIYRKPRGPTQCMRCQLLGHAHSNCFRPARCVKCSGEHLTSECEYKEKIATPQCSNCGGQHPANYRGCTYYKTYVKNIKASHSHNKGNSGTRQPPVPRATQQAPRAANPLPARDTPAFQRGFPSVDGERDAARDLATPPRWPSKHPLRTPTVRTSGVTAAQPHGSTPTSTSIFQDIFILFKQLKDFILSLTQNNLFTIIKNALHAISNANDSSQKLIIITDVLTNLLLNDTN